MGFIEPLLGFTLGLMFKDDEKYSEHAEFFNKGAKLILSLVVISLIIIAVVIVIIPMFKLIVA